MLKIISQRINDRFGGRRGLLAYWIYQCRYYLGGYRREKSVNWDRVTVLVFVCHGNICRSPLAEVVARSQGYRCRSVGLSCTAGAAADPRAQAFATSAGLDLSSHGATPAADTVFAENELLVCMEPAHLRHPLISGVESAQITLLGLWLIPRAPYIHDPYSTSEAFFDRCENTVTAATKNLLSYAPLAREA